MAAAIARRRDAPEDQNAKQKLAEIVAVGNRCAEEVAQQHGKKNIDRDDSHEDGRHPFDRVDEAVHAVAGHDGPFGVHPSPSSGRVAERSEVGWGPTARPCRGKDPTPTLPEDGEGAARSPRPQYPALYFASWSLSSFMAAAGSTPTLRTLSAQVFSNGSAAFFHCAS